MKPQTGIYLVTFNMQKPINSQTGWGQTKMKTGMMITSNMVKIGKFENGEEGRRKNYEKTYGTFFKMEIIWSGNLNKEDIRKLESYIKKEFKQYRHRNPLTKYPSEYIELAKIALPEIQHRLKTMIDEFLSEIRQIA